MIKLSVQFNFGKSTVHMTIFYLYTLNRILQTRLANAIVFDSDVNCDDDDGDDNDCGDDGDDGGGGW